MIVVGITNTIIAPILTGIGFIIIINMPRKKKQKVKNLNRQLSTPELKLEKAGKKKKLPSVDSAGDIYKSPRNQISKDKSFNLYINSISQFD
jgi:ABC-type Na+ efflux pump permease subunit